MNRPCWKHLGDVGVDSAAILIADPCYLRGMDEKLDALTGVFVADEGQVAFMPNSGDGIYPVWAYLDERGKIIAVWIDCREEATE